MWPQQCNVPAAELLQTSHQKYIDTAKEDINTHEAHITAQKALKYTHKILKRKLV